MNGFAKISDKPTALEQKNREIALWAAAEGIVLLENDGTLPFSGDIRRIALFGNGARKTVKGGTGSGDVNERSYVTVEMGLEAAGYEIVTKKWLDAYDQIWTNDRVQWKKELEKKASENNIPFVIAYLETVHLLPTMDVTDEYLADADAALYVIGRRSGEGSDRLAESGDYYLSDDEKSGLMRIRKAYKKLVIVFNAGGPVDTTWLNQMVNPSALIVLSQAGMCGGTALAGILSGKYTPSGKLTDTWAKEYNDYPEADNFSIYSKNPKEIFYREGIYTGYRYFTTADKPVAYPFGYGMSYTQFAIEYTGYELSGGIKFSIKVTNIGKTAGKEVVQVYVKAPEKNMKKPSRILAGFAKTKLLEPGNSQILTVNCPLDTWASYEEKSSREILESGKYVFYIGNSVTDAKSVLCLEIDEEICLRKYNRALSASKEFEELEIMRHPEDQSTVEKIRLNKEQIVHMVEEWQKCNEQYENYHLTEEKKAFLSSQEDKMLIQLVTGVTREDKRSEVGNSSSSVPGAAGQTSAKISGIPEMVMADGGSGIRLLHHFQTDQEGNVLENGDMFGLERGAFADPVPKRENVVDYYQYCTAFPIGTLMAQTWNEEICHQVGESVGKEMQEFGVHIWLAPSINIHRNPLCGRNFEYYSEDPLLTGRMAAAVCLGVQSVKGCAVTIKHFVANNQELYRHNSDSIVSERTLREIYLKTFEIVIRTAHPLAIMTSYNKVNGIQTANRHDLCTQIAREEYGFDGLIMTDWGTTDPGDSDPVICIKCGNDLIMPGGENDRERIKKALEEGKLTREELENAAAHIAGVAWRFVKK